MRLIYVLFAIAAALAIPTYGISLVVFFFLKSKYDKTAVNAIMASAVSSMRTNAPHTLYKVNRSAIRRVFSKFCEDGVGTRDYHQGHVSAYGTLRHPLINNGEEFSLRLFREPGGTTMILAAPGYSHEVMEHAELDRMR